MASFDEDAVQEALRRVQPLLDALAARIAVLEAGGGTGTGAPVFPDRVTEDYPDGVQAVYVRQS